MPKLGTPEFPEWMKRVLGEEGYQELEDNERELGVEKSNKFMFEAFVASGKYVVKPWRGHMMLYPVGDPPRAPIEEYPEHAARLGIKRIY